MTRGVRRHDRGQFDPFCARPGPRPDRLLDPDLIITRRVVMRDRQRPWNAVDRRDAPHLPRARSDAIVRQRDRIVRSIAQPDPTTARRPPPPAQCRQAVEHTRHTVARRRIADQHLADACIDLGRQCFGNCSCGHAAGIGDDLERQRRNAVAEIGELQPLEHRIGTAAIRRCRGIGGSDQRIGRLVLTAQMKPEVRRGFPVARRAPQQLALCPDAADALDRARRQQHRKIRRITIGRGRWLPLAAPRCRPSLDQVGRPDHRPRHADRPEQLGDLGAIARCLHRQVAQPRPLACRRREHPRIDRSPDQRADRSPDRATHRTAHRRENQRRHACIPPRLRQSATPRSTARAARPAARPPVAAPHRRARSPPRS